MIIKMPMNNIFYTSRKLTNYPVEQCKQDVIDTLDVFNCVEIISPEKPDNYWLKNDDGTWSLNFIFFSKEQRETILFSVTVNEIAASSSHYTFISIKANRDKNSWYNSVSSDVFKNIQEEVSRFSALFFDAVQELFFYSDSMRRHIRKEMKDEYENSNPVASILFIIIVMFLVAGVIGYWLVSFFSNSII